MKLEDVKQQRQYKKLDSSVRFYSLKDFDTCERVEEFLEKIKEAISKDNSNTNADTRTSLFLQDFPSKGMQNANIAHLISNHYISVGESSFEGLKMLKEDIDPRYFWVSLRSDNAKTVNSFRDYLDFEVYDFSSHHK